MAEGKMGGRRGGLTNARARADGLQRATRSDQTLHDISVFLGGGGRGWPPTRWVRGRILPPSNN